MTLAHSYRVCGVIKCCCDALLCAKFSSVCLEDSYTDKKVIIFSVRKRKAYGTRCSQAVPHPSTILARRCLTSVIRRERVCSSWYGRRRQLVKSACSHSTLAQIGYVYGHTCSRMPQVQKNHIPGRPWKAIFKLQIKNIKLHIVTDIKVTINSIFEFRISSFGWGEGHYS